VCVRGGAGVSVCVCMVDVHRYLQPEHVGVAVRCGCVKVSCVQMFMHLEWALDVCVLVV